MGRAFHPHEPRGYFGIALWLPKYEVNVGSVMRSALVFGARFVIVVGDRYRRQRTDTPNILGTIPIWHTPDGESFWRVMPEECQLVSLELDAYAKPLPSYDHPLRAVYVFGPEDGDVPDGVRERSQVVQIPGTNCLNLASSASILMYDRIAKRARLYKRERVA